MLSLFSGNNEIPESWLPKLKYCRFKAAFLLGQKDKVSPEFIGNPFDNPNMKSILE